MLYWVSLFILGEVSYRVLPIGILVIFTAGIGMGILYIPAAYIRENRQVLLIGELFLLFGAACMADTGKKLAFCQEREGVMVSFAGTVMETESSAQGERYLVKTKEIDGKRQRVSIRITLQSEEHLQPGTRILGSGEGKAFLRATNPGGYDERSYQYGKGVFLSLKNTVIRKRAEPKFPVRELLYQVRVKLSGVYDALLDEKDASLARAMVLGDKASLDADVKQLYQRNGIAHLIAISGLHIAMIGGLFYQFFRKCTGSYPAAAGIGILFIGSYGVMTGLSGSAFRAIVMLAVSIGADVYGRRYDTLTAIAAALFIMLLCNPCQITQAGFLLSFGAVLGIALVHPVWQQLLGKIPKYLEGLFVSISVQLTLLPVMLCFFYEIPLYGFLLNLFVVPLMSLLLLMLILCAVTGSVCLNAALLFARVSQGIFGIYEALCHMSEKLPFHTMCTGRPSVCWIVIYYSVLLLFVAAAYQKRKLGRWLSVAAWAALLAYFWLPGPLVVCMFDVGQGDGIYIRTPHRVHVLMDGGSSSKQKVGTYVLKSGVKYYGGGAFDYVFISHSDSDHYSGILELLEDDSVKIDNVVLPDIVNPDEAYQELVKKARGKGCHIYFMKKGDRLEVDGVRFLCLNPEHRAYEDKNQGSIVLQVTYQRFDLLLTGDMDQTVEAEIMNQIEGTLEVLKVAHHGSKTASSEAFLEKLEPDVACVSVGVANRYGHPAPEVMERLERFCRMVYLTKDSGAVTIRTDGERYRVETFLKDE